MKRALAVMLLVATTSCSAVPPPPTTTAFADALIARSSAPAAAPAGRGVDSAVPAPRHRVHAEAPRIPARLLTVARDETALDAFLSGPYAADDLAHLVVLRSEEVAVGRARLQAARTGYGQSSDLDDLSGLYRSYLRDLDTRIGPARHRRPAAAISPSPNVTGLSGEIVDRTVELAREALRGTELSVAADARRAHAEVAHWVVSRRIVGEDLRLLEGLLAVTRAKLESGQADQAGYLALAAAVTERRSELEVLEEKRPPLAARLNRLLARPEDAELSLDLVADEPVRSIRDEKAVVARALAASPAVRMAALRAERASLAVRLAETMTLPRLDIGSARFERERVGEAGIDRGPVFPDPGRMIMPRSDFGVREAQVSESRARAEAMAAEEREASGRAAASVRRGLFAVTAAEKRLAALDDEIIPSGERELRAARGSYEGNRSSYLALLEAARSLLKARLDRAGAIRDLSIARADLLVAAGFDPGEDSDR